MRRAFLIIVLLTLIPFQLSYLYSNTNSQAGTVAGLKSLTSDEINNSVSIGEFHFNLYGYTSPQAVVTIDGQGIYDQSVSDNNGYYQFANRFSPFSPREACLSSKDQFGRVSSSICLPPFPVKYDVNIGPVIIPPTISLDKDVYYIGDKIILSGQTIPNSEVNLSMFTKNKTIGDKLLSTSLVKPVDAFTFPNISTKSDNKGNYSLSLPSQISQRYNIFSQTQYQKNSSPNSIKLNFNVYPIWMIILQFFGFICSLIKPRLIELSIILELLIVSYFIYNQLLKHSQKAIVLRPKENIEPYHKKEISLIEE